MSEQSGDAQSAVVSALGGNPGATQGNGGSQGQPAQQPQGDQGLANGFLDKVDPAHRSIVEPYVKQWDAGVTRRFQDLHGQLAPYQELGDPEMLASAARLYEMIDTNPQQVYDLLAEALGQQQGGGAPEQQTGQPGEPQVPGQEGQQPQAAPGLPPEVQQQLDTLQQVVEAVAQKTLDAEGQQQQAQEDQQLEDYFGLLKEEFGEFDDDFVAAKMLGGMDGEQAVQAYKSAIQGQVNQRSQAPQMQPILSGGGTVPQDQQSVAKASSKDIKGLIANVLAQANQG